MNAVDPDNESTFQVRVIPSDLRETGQAKEAVLAELAHNEYGEQAVFGMNLALEEALTNAVKHGNRNDPSKSITVRFAVSPDKAVVIVRDQGVGFAPEQIPDCTCAERLPLPNGRGVMLIKAYMDEVCYRDNGREIYFMKRRDPGVSCPCPCSTAIRRTTHYSGNVQGVFFRATARDLAARFCVTGFVRNLPDGRVELVTEGTEVEVDRFEAAVENAMKDHIGESQSTDSPATTEFKTFAIAR